MNSGAALPNGAASELLYYCRAGFEPELAAELMTRASRSGHGAYPRFDAQGGFLRLIPVDGAVEPLAAALPLQDLIFARQALRALPPLSGLPRDDRLTPIVESLLASGWTVDAIWHETPDTNAGKALNRLTRVLERPLASVLRKRGVLKSHAQGRRLHCFWSRGDCVQLGLSLPGQRSEWPGGVLRLRAPRDAPSRSTLKLEEAWHQFIPREEWDTRLAEGMTAADLGAAPGGWTYQLVRRGMHVHAVDNGPMDPQLMATTQVEHHRADAYAWRPPRQVDWLVCDMVDQPARVTARVTEWLAGGWCREAVFNLKLPMKQRWAMVQSCLADLQQGLASAGVSATVRARQLYHDREEITVHVRLEPVHREPVRPKSRPRRSGA